MLTSDLVRALTKKGRIAPRYLVEKDRDRLGAYADSLIATYASMVGATRAELDEATAAIPIGSRDRPIGLGLRKLCDDRTTLEQESPLDPVVVRASVFGAAAKRHRSPEPFQRELALADAAAALGASVEAIERALFADLREAQAVKAFDSIATAELFARYNVSLAQAILLRATRVTITLTEPRPKALRDLFRAARFHGLLYVIERGKDAASWTVRLDGPFSLFDSVQKYGLRLALFLPSVLALTKFELCAEVVWGPKREPMELRLDKDDGLDPPNDKPIYERPEVTDLVAAFRALGSAWDVSANDRLLVAKDGSAVVPDLVFESRATGEEVFLEVFGFWSRAAVWRRVEQIQAGLPARLILAVSKQARVSEEVLDDGEGGSSIYVWKTALSAKEILSRLG